MCVCEEEGEAFSEGLVGGRLPAESRHPNENIITTSESEERDCLRDDSGIRQKSDN